MSNRPTSKIKTKIILLKLKLIWLQVVLIYFTNLKKKCVYIHVKTGIWMIQKQSVYLSNIVCKLRNVPQKRKFQNTHCPEY